MLPPDDTPHATAPAPRRARTGCRPVERVSETHGIARMDAGYAVAAINTRARFDEPVHRIAG